MGKSPKKGAATTIHLIDTPSNDLVSGEYYANKSVTSTTAYSYDMKKAELLAERIKGYLDNYSIHLL